jgi:hypothetical protein
MESRQARFPALDQGHPMISSWILDKLTPLTGQPVIVLRDPQRMIVSGAHAVNGWAEEHGYTVLFCTGNVALREMYEAIREDAEAKILLVDRSRTGTLFYPDLQARAKQEAALSLSLRDFLIEQTGDPAWPKLLDDRHLSGLLLENVPAVIQAYQDLRSAAPHRFSDSDLYKIALGAALHINPFKPLSPGEIRRLCIEQHTRLESLKERLPADVLATLHNGIAKAPKPFCWLLERNPAVVMRAFTLAAILRQHKLDYRLLMANIDPLLHDYKDIEPAFLDQAIQDQLTADTDQVLDDVRLVEQSLRQNPAGLALLLHDQLQVDDRKHALAVLQSERLSNLVRGLALASLLADLILTKDLKFHRQVIKDLDHQERDTALPALRRPAEQWQALTSTYRRAISVFELTAVLARTANALKVVEAGELDFQSFERAWNEARLNRLDFYLSDLERLLRVGDILPLPANTLWAEFVKRWGDARQAFQQTSAAAEKALDLINARFQDFYRLHYTRWLQRSDIPVIFTHQFLPRLLKPYWDAQKGPKAIILVFDGLRTDAWDEFLRPLLEERYELIHSQAGSAILPTETELSRKAISAGKLPADFPAGSKRESDLLQAWFKENMDFTPDFQIVRDSDTEASGMVVRYVSPRLEYIVFNFTDENLHNNPNELALIYGSVVREMVQHDVRSVLRDLPDDALIFVTSDHGFSPLPKTIIHVPSSALVDDHDVKYRNARTRQKLAGADAERSVDFDVRVMGIPRLSPSVRDTPFNYVLFPRPGYIFKRAKGPHNPDRYSHGGLSMAECLVPMAVFGPRKAARQLITIESVRQVGSAIENEMLELEITLQASQTLTRETPVTLSFNREEMPVRKEIFSGMRKTILIRWSPRIGDIPDEARQAGVLALPVSALLSYREGERLVRDSKAADVRIKLNTTRLRRRLDSKLDLLMGKVPKELKG